MPSLSLRRFVGTAFTTLAVATAACGGDDNGSTGPQPAPADVSGTYALTSLRSLGSLGGGGNGLPVTFTDGSGSTLTFSSGCADPERGRQLHPGSRGRVQRWRRHADRRGPVRPGRQRDRLHPDRRSRADAGRHHQRQLHDGGDPVRRDPVRDRSPEVIQTERADRRRAVRAGRRQWKPATGLDRSGRGRGGRCSVVAASSLETTDYVSSSSPGTISAGAAAPHHRQRGHLAVPALGARPDLGRDRLTRAGQTSARTGCRWSTGPGTASGARHTGCTFGAEPLIFRSKKGSSLSAGWRTSESSGLSAKAGTVRWGSGASVSPRDPERDLRPTRMSRYGRGLALFVTLSARGGAHAAERSV